MLYIFWKCVRVHFTYDSQLLYLVFFSCTINQYLTLSRQQKVDLVFYFIVFYFYFYFYLFFIFSIFRTLGLGLEVINHISHI